MPGEGVHVLVRGERTRCIAAPRRRLPLIWSEIITLSQKILVCRSVVRCVTLLIRTQQQQVRDEIWKLINAWNKAPAERKTPPPPPYAASKSVGRRQLGEKTRESSKHDCMS